MNSILPIKKLLRIAVYTSTAVGFITIGPVYIVAVLLANMKITLSVLIRLIGISVTGISFFIFLIWLINIVILYFSRKKIFFFRKKNMRYVWSYLFCFFIFFSGRLLVNPILNNPEKVQKIIEMKSRTFGLDPQNFNFLPYNDWLFQVLILFFVIFSVNSVVLIIQDLVLLIEKKTKIENENSELKMKNMEAVNQKLKQQLQPHFLFNSLNVLKTLIRKQPDNAEMYVKRLSDFLRASLLYDGLNTLPLREELKLSLDYIEIQKIRFGDAIRFRMNIPEEAGNGFLPVFSIQMLLENAIKHNAFTRELPLFIELFYENERIIIRNNLQPKPSVGHSNGLGLVNLSERYKILSGDEVLIQSDDSAFSVSIKILQE